LDSSIRKSGRRIYMIYDGGIFRDAFLVSAPNVQIRDYTVRTNLDSSFTNANLEISMDIRNLSGGEKNSWSVIAKAYDEAGNNILKGASVKLDKLNIGKDKSVVSTNIKSHVRCLFRYRKKFSRKLFMK